MRKVLTTLRNRSINMAMWIHCVTVLTLVTLSRGEVLRFQPKNLIDNLLQLKKSQTTDPYKWPPAFCNGLDCPKYTVLKNGTDYELRRYEMSHWVSTNIAGVDYKDATSTDFRRLFNYISGTNKQKKKIAMTAPVTVEIHPGQGPACENNFTMSFFMSPKVTTPPDPSDSKVFLRKQDSMDVYVRSFGGNLFNDINTWIKEAGKLAESIGDKSLYRTDYYYTAGYDSPFKLFNRHNEIWFIAN